MAEKASCRRRFQICSNFEQVVVVMFWLTRTWKLHLKYTTWKVPKCGVFSGLYFPVFGLNTEIYSVNLRTQSEYRTGKYGPEKTPHLNTFHTVVIMRMLVASTFAMLENVWWSRLGFETHLKRVTHMLLVKLDKGQYGKQL